MGCGGCGGGGSGGGGGFPQPCNIIPTISCALASGAPASYLYDPFDDVRGWWNLSASYLDGGFLKPTGVTRNPTAVNLNIGSANPVGAELVTFIMNVRYQRFDNLTPSGAVGFRLGQTAAAENRYLVMGGFDNQAKGGYFQVRRINSSAFTSQEFYELQPPAVGSITDYELKAVVSPTTIDYYLDGVLKYSEILTLNFPGGFPQAITTDYVAGPQIAWPMDFALFGYGLPVNC